MKTAELTGALLDYYVARAEGKQILWYNPDRPPVIPKPGGVRDDFAMDYSPSTDWVQGGPLIEKHFGSFDFMVGGGYLATIRMKGFKAFVGMGRTPLQAICRAVVRAAFGDEVEEVAV